VTATLNSACNSFSQPVSKEQHLVDHVIREFAATVKHVQKLQNLITLNIINMKNSSYTTVVNNY